MCRKIASLLLLAGLAGACNKETGLTTSLPFGVFPNPCRGQVSAIYTGPPSNNVSCVMLDRKGKEIAGRTDFGNGQIITVALAEKGIYYFEVTVDGAVFKEEILNLE